MATSLSASAAAHAAPLSRAYLNCTNSPAAAPPPCTFSCRHLIRSPLFSTASTPLGRALTTTRCQGNDASVSAQRPVEEETVTQASDAADAAGNGVSTSGWDTEDRLQPVAEVYNVKKTRALVETAMLSAVTGLAYMLASIIKVEGYLGYLLPLPIVLAALRSGPTAARKTMTATAFLLLVLLGPIRSLAYLLMHGGFACTLGALWSLRAPWALSVPAAAAVRVCGTLGYLAISSWTLNENLFALLLSNVFSLLDQMAALLGLSGAPSPAAVACTVVSLLVVNALFYCLLIHLLYEALLGGLGYSAGAAPSWARRLLLRNRVAAQ